MTEKPTYWVARRASLASRGMRQRSYTLSDDVVAKLARLALVHRLSRTDMVAKLIEDAAAAMTDNDPGSDGWG